MTLVGLSQKALTTLAMTVFKINEETGMGTMVHGYCFGRDKFKAAYRIFFDYILKNFNIVFIIGDYNGGAVYKML